MESTRRLAEAKIEAYRLKKEDDKTKLILAAIIEHALGDQQREAVSATVAACEDDQALYNLSQAFIMGLLVPLRAAGEQASAITEGPFHWTPGQDLDNTETHILPAERHQKDIRKKAST
ncbi:hypothetical protein BDV93DRAFT_526611 [Ceratobasidium sp. AG-I]|nr:hypothetical protein BDV93DRAFT_526611 [Ceratobasidium sp. AG-I]